MIENMFNELVKINSTIELLNNRIIILKGII